MNIHINEDGLIGWIVTSKIIGGVSTFRGRCYHFVDHYHHLIDSVRKSHNNSCDFYGVWMILK